MLAVPEPAGPSSEPADAAGRPAAAGPQLHYHPTSPLSTDAGRLYGKPGIRAYLSTRALCFAICGTELVYGGQVQAPVQGQQPGATRDRSVDFVTSQLTATCDLS
eukprot:2398371-Rhodomonas_salina.3